MPDDTKVFEFPLITVSLKKSPFWDSSFTNINLSFTANLTKVLQLKC